MGIQMETGKPGWNDAMNGLPGILGSTMPESYETLRVLKYLKKVIQRYPKQDFEVPTEMSHAYAGGGDAVGQLLPNVAGVSAHHDWQSAIG